MRGLIVVGLAALLGALGLPACGGSKEKTTSTTATATAAGLTVTPPQHWTVRNRAGSGLVVADGATLFTASPVSGAPQQLDALLADAARDSKLIENPRSTTV